MTVKELYNAKSDENKLKSLYLELARHEDLNPYKSNVVSDMPRGGDGKNFLEWYAEEGDRIRREIVQCKKKLQEDKEKLNDFIENAPYPECDIIRYRVIHNKSWEDIGDIVGYSRFQVSRKFRNYIKSCS